MPLNKRTRSPGRRNAKANAKRRYRNAAPTAPTRLTAAKAAPPGGPPTLGTKFVELGESAVGSAVVTLLGSQLVRWGLNPMYVSIGAGGVGASLALIPKSSHLRQLGNGAAGAAMSQLTLLALNPAPAPAPPPAPKAPSAPPPQPQPPVRLKNADLGTLPPGMLDAAFERARAELAVQSDGLGHEPVPRFHHGPVMPSGMP